MLRILHLLLKVCNLRCRPLPKDIYNLKMEMAVQGQNDVIDLIKGKDYEILKEGG
jgi:hypothetical protein